MYIYMCVCIKTMYTPYVYICIPLMGMSTRKFKVLHALLIHAAPLKLRT